MLRDSFYSIVSQEALNDTSSLTKVSINATHPVFEGHFPEQPVVPGVCMLQMVKDIVSDKVQRVVQLQSIGNVKFTSVVIPQQHPELDITIKYESSDDHSIKISSTISADETVFLKISSAVYI
ncbi:MAG: hypothetical protein U0U67_09470 [Chitinophagales bacterium]